MATQTGDYPEPLYPTPSQLQHVGQAAGLQARGPVGNSPPVNMKKKLGVEVVNNIMLCKNGSQKLLENLQDFEKLLYGPPAELNTEKSTDQSPCFGWLTTVEEDTAKINDAIGRSIFILHRIIEGMGLTSEKP